MWTVTTFCSQIAWTLLIALGVKVVWWNWENRKVLSLSRRFKFGHRALPLIGHIILRGFSNVAITNLVLQKLKESVENYVKIAVIWLGPYPIISISDPKDVQILLNSGKTIDEAEEHRLLRLIFGNGLLSAPGRIWKVTRRHISPLFHPHNLNQLMPLMNECGRDLTSILSGHVGPIDVSSPVFAVALKSVHHLVFGLQDKIDVQSKEFRGLLITMDCAAYVLSNRLYKYWAFNDLLFRYIFKKEIRSIESGWKTYLKHATQRAKKRSSQRQMSDDNGSVDEVSKDQPERDGTSHLTLVEAFQRLRHLYPQFTEKDLENEIMTFLVTGSDTTKWTLSSCLLALAAYPKVQEKLYAEVMSVVGTEDTDVTIQDLRAMTYLEQVIKETLRKFFLVSSVTRKVSEDLKISECTLPAGSTAIVILPAIHYNSKNFPDPDKFDPDRFTPENVAQRDKYSFIGFSGGPRNCIGKNYAMNAMKTWIVHVVRKYKLSTQVNIDNIKYKVGFVASSATGYAIQFEKDER